MTHAHLAALAWMSTVYVAGTINGALLLQFVQAWRHYRAAVRAETDR